MKTKPFWWPDERQWVTIGLFGLTGVLLQMATDRPSLWDVKLFEVLIQAVVMTGLLNMVLSFHFAANKAANDMDHKRAENTAAAFRAIEAAAGTPTDAPQPVTVVNTPDEPVPVEEPSK